MRPSVSIIATVIGVIALLGLPTPAAAATYIPSVTHLFAQATSNGHTVTLSVSNNIPASFAPIGCNWGLWRPGDVPAHVDGPAAVVGGGPDGVITPGQSKSQTFTVPDGEYRFHWFCLAEGVGDSLETAEPGPWFWGTPSLIPDQSLATPPVVVVVSGMVPDPECTGSLCMFGIA